MAKAPKELVSQLETEFVSVEEFEMRSNSLILEVKNFNSSRKYGVNSKVMNSKRVTPQDCYL